MNKLNQIIEGWKNYIFKNKEIEEKAKERIKICVSCEKFKKITKQCGICKCFMPARVRLENPKCPLKKWN